MNAQWIAGNELLLPPGYLYQTVPGEGLENDQEPQSPKSLSVDATFWQMVLQYQDMYKQTERQFHPTCHKTAERAHTALIRH